MENPHCILEPSLKQTDYLKAQSCHENARWRPRVFTAEAPVDQAGHLHHLHTFGASGASNKKPNKIGPMHSAMLFPVVKAPASRLPTKKNKLFQASVRAML